MKKPTAINITNSRMSARRPSTADQESPNIDDADWRGSAFRFFATRKAFVRLVSRVLSPLPLNQPLPQGDKAAIAGLKSAAPLCESRLHKPKCRRVLFAIEEFFQDFAKGRFVRHGAGEQGHR